MQDKLVIETHLEFKDGQAYFIDRSIKVEPVARMHINGGASIEEVMSHYGLDRAEVYAALTYFFDNQETLDRRYEESLAIGKQAGAVDSTAFRAEIERRMRDRS
ncbi:MAG: hypothetical protein CL610_23670 [Anaerolineaceae bacterium]|nr:hypothetical protein [Anaerolineaceae bacterium]